MAVADGATAAVVAVGPRPNQKIKYQLKMSLSKQVRRRLMKPKFLLRLMPNTGTVATMTGVGACSVLTASATIGLGVTVSVGETTEDTRGLRQKPNTAHTVTAIGGTDTDTGMAVGDTITMTGEKLNEQQHANSRSVGSWLKSRSQTAHFLKAKML